MSYRPRCCSMRMQCLLCTVLLILQSSLPSITFAGIERMRERGGGEEREKERGIVKEVTQPQKGLYLLLCNQEEVQSLFYKCGYGAPSVLYNSK